MKCKVCLLGNHDQGALFDPEGFNTGAERAIFWTRQQLENPAAARQRPPAAGISSANCRGTIRRAPYLFVHGSARNPLNEYVFPEDIYNRRKMEKIFALIEQYAFQGHTHVPGVFTEDLRFFSPEEIDYEYRLRRPKSHGQRRLGRPAARRRSPCMLRGARRRHRPVPEGGVSLRGDDRARSTPSPNWTISSATASAMDASHCTVACGRDNRLLWRPC